MTADSQRQRIENHIRDTYGAEPEHLWERYPDYAVFRHPASRKWYAAVMVIPADRLGLERGGSVEIVNLKCGHILLGSLLGDAGFFPAYHMSKSSWVSVLLDGTVPDERIFRLIDLSWDSVAPAKRKTT